MDKEVDMYLNEVEKQRLEDLLSEAKKKYRPAEPERPEKTFAIARGKA